MDHYRAIASNSTSLNCVSDSNSAHKHQQNQSETTKIKQPSTHRPSIHPLIIHPSTIHPSTIHPSIIQPLIFILSPYFWLSAKLRCSQTFVFNEESAFQSSNQNQAMTVHFIFEFITDWPLEEFYRTHTQGQKSEEKNCRIQNSPNTSWLTV